MNRLVPATALAGVLLTATACGSESGSESGAGAAEAADAVAGVEGATLHTSAGDIGLVLFGEQAPVTVLNFVELAEGDRTENPETGNAAYYDGTVFHRVIPEFMIQGGDPTGTGSGGPGYEFEDEIVEELTFAEPGTLAMANSGPGTNGSQFFVTTAPTPHLDGMHTIFGEVADEESLAVAGDVSRVETGDADRPVEDVVLESVDIHRAG